MGLLIYNLAKLHAQWSQFFQTSSVFLYVSQLRFLHQDFSLNHITSFQQYWQMLIANKPCRAIQTFDQLFFPVTWYDTVLWYYPECTVTDKWECITGSFSVWVSVWHSDRVQDLHRAPFVWCWCLSLPLRAPGMLSYPLMPVELYYIKICNKNNIPAIAAGGVMRWSQTVLNTNTSEPMIDACMLRLIWGQMWLMVVYTTYTFRPGRDRVQSCLQVRFLLAYCTMGDVQGKHDSWLTGQTAAAEESRMGCFHGD